MQIMRTAPMALALAATAATAEAPAALAPPTSGEIRLFQSAERVLVMMQIGDGDLVPMVFDTGSDGNTIDATLTKRLRLKRIGTVEEVDGTSGTIRRLPQVAVRRITLGGVPVRELDAASVPYDRSDAMGIVSSEIFTGSLVWLDLASHRATLTPRTATPTGPATAYVERIPTVQMTMPDGSTLPAHFDTGFNGALSLPVALMGTVPLIAPAKVVGRWKSISASGEVMGGRVKGNIKIGPVTLENPEVTFLGELANIGLPVIRRVTLVIDPVADRNWILPAGTRPARVE